jgi:hypothetical protein
MPNQRGTEGGWSQRIDPDLMQQRQRLFLKLHPEGTEEQLFSLVSVHLDEALDTMPANTVALEMSTSGFRPGPNGKSMPPFNPDRPGT